MPESELNGHVRSKTLLELAKLRRYIIQHWDQPEGGKSVKTLSQRFACSPSLSVIRAYAFGGEKDSTGFGAAVRSTVTQRLDGYVHVYTTIDNSVADRSSRSHIKNICLICIGSVCIVTLASVTSICYVYSIHL